MINWLHKFFYPHCPECIAEREQSEICYSCETLRIQLEIANNEKKQLLSKLIDKPIEPLVERSAEIPISKNIPWNVRRQMLEAEDRQKARIIAEKNREMKSTEELEKEIGITELEEKDAIRQSDGKI